MTLAGRGAAAAVGGVGAVLGRVRFRIERKWSVIDV